MAFPDVLAVIFNPSSMGTPLVNRVARVRVNRRDPDLAQYVSKDGTFQKGSVYDMSAVVGFVVAPESEYACGNTS